MIKAYVLAVKILNIQRSAKRGKTFSIKRGHRVKTLLLLVSLKLSLDKLKPEQHHNTPLNFSATSSSYLSRIFSTTSSMLHLEESNEESLDLEESIILISPFFTQSKSRNTWKHKRARQRTASSRSMISTARENGAKSARSSDAGNHHAKYGHTRSQYLFGFTVERGPFGGKFVKEKRFGGCRAANRMTCSENQTRIF